MTKKLHPNSEYPKWVKLANQHLKDDKIMILLEVPKPGASKPCFEIQLVKKDNSNFSFEETTELYRNFEANLVCEFGLLTVAKCVKEHLCLKNGKRLPLTPQKILAIDKACRAATSTKNQTKMSSDSLSDKESTFSTPIQPVDINSELQTMLKGRDDAKENTKNHKTDLDSSPQFVLMPHLQKPLFNLSKDEKFQKKSNLLAVAESLKNETKDFMKVMNGILLIYKISHEINESNNNIFSLIKSIVNETDQYPLSEIRRKNFTVKELNQYDVEIQDYIQALKEDINKSLQDIIDYFSK